MSKVMATQMATRGNGCITVPSATPLVEIRSQIKCSLQNFQRNNKGQAQVNPLTISSMPFNIITWHVVRDSRSTPTLSSTVLRYDSLN